MRYVVISDDASVETIDEALAIMRQRRKATGFALVRGWIDAEIDTLLDMRNAAVLEAMV